MSPRSLLLGVVMLMAPGLAGCATEPDSAALPQASNAPAQGDGVLVRNLHATPRYRGGPPLSSIYYKRQPRS